LTVDVSDMAKNLEVEIDAKSADYKRFLKEAQDANAKLQELYEKRDVILRGNSISQST
jgi:hypothetical protein